MKEQTVLFVCVHNSGRSQMAEAMTNALAQERGVPVRGLSAGTVGGRQLNPMALEAMKEIGISMDGQTPKLITQEMVEQADRIISMGCGVDAEACPARFALTEDWDLDDPAGRRIEEVRRIRDQIQKHVGALILELSGK